MADTENTNNEMTFESEDAYYDYLAEKYNIEQGLISCEEDKIEKELEEMGAWG